MDVVLRAFAIYVFLLIVFRISGKRTITQVTTFDFVLLLIIGEATQQALLGEDFSLTAAALVIVTLVGLDIVMSLLKQRSKKLDRILDGTPLVIVEDGRPLEDRMKKSRVGEEDVLEEARHQHGLERLSDIKYSVLERSGQISIIPKR